MFLPFSIYIYILFFFHLKCFLFYLFSFFFLYLFLLPGCAHISVLFNCFQNGFYQFFFQCFTFLFSKQKVIACFVVMAIAWVLDCF